MLKDRKCLLFDISSILANRKLFSVFKTKTVPSHSFLLQGLRRGLWGAMSDETQEHPSQKSLTGQHALIIYWLAAPADQTDLLHYNISAVWLQSGDTLHIKVKFITPKFYILFVLWFL